MCKLLRCTPSELDEQDSLDIEVIEYVIGVVGEKNPLIGL
jgi:hypothetical protein